MSYELRKAQRELDDFLEKNPDLINTQRSIDNMLNRSTDRIGTLSFLISDNLSELQTELKLLKYKLEEMIK